MKDLTILPMARNPTNLIYDKRHATVCKWNAVTESGLNSNNLKCMLVLLYNGDQCHYYSPDIDFKQKHYCGRGEEKEKFNSVIRFKIFCLLNLLNANLSK